MKKVDDKKKSTEKPDTPSKFEQKQAEKKEEIKKMLITPGVPDSNLAITIFVTDKGGLDYKFDSSKLAPINVKQIFKHLFEEIDRNMLTQEILTIIARDSEKMGRLAQEAAMNKSQIINPNTNRPVDKPGEESTDKP